MGGSLKFPDDSRDEIEKLYASTILVSFPNYGKFWGALIGRKGGEANLLPYGLRYPAHFVKGTRKGIENSYHHVALAHYAVFCDLAGAHFQLEEASTISAAISSDRRLFAFLEDFTNFYNHLGTARFMARYISADVSAIERLCRPLVGRARRSKTQSEDVLSRFLREKSRSDLVERLRILERNVLAVRDNQVHQFRPFLTSLNNRFHLYEPISRTPSPLPSHRTRGEASDALMRMEGDLTSIEVFLNDLDAVFLEELMASFAAAGIQVDSG